MRLIPENLRREIKRANKKANKLRRKNGYPAVSKINDFNFTNIEVKIPIEDLNKDDIDLFKEYAYFYNREDLLMGAEKIKDGKLKEYYDKATYFDYNLKDFESFSLICSKDLIVKKLDDYFMQNGIPEIGFKINNHSYMKRYYSFNSETNELEDIYFYRKEVLTTSDIIISSKYLSGSNNCTDIIRVSNKTFKVNKLYLSVDKPDLHVKGLNDPDYCFYYFSPEQNLEAILVNVAS